MFELHSYIVEHRNQQLKEHEQHIVQPRHGRDNYCVIIVSLANCTSMCLCG